MDILSRLELFFSTSITKYVYLKINLNLYTLLVSAMSEFVTELRDSVRIRTQIWVDLSKVFFYDFMSEDNIIKVIPRFPYISIS